MHGTRFSEPNMQNTTCAFSNHNLKRRGTIRANHVTRLSGLAKQALAPPQPVRITPLLSAAICPSLL